MESTPRIVDRTRGHSQGRDEHRLHARRDNHQRDGWRSIERVAPWLLLTSVLLAATMGMLVVFSVSQRRAAMLRERLDAAPSVGALAEAKDRPVDRHLNRREEARREGAAPIRMEGEQALERPEQAGSSGEHQTDPSQAEQVSPAMVEQEAERQPPDLHSGQPLRSEPEERGGDERLLDDLDVEREILLDVERKLLQFEKELAKQLQQGGS